MSFADPGSLEKEFEGRHASVLSVRKKTVGGDGRRTVDYKEVQGAQPVCSMVEH